MSESKSIEQFKIEEFEQRRNRLINAVPQRLQYTDDIKQKLKIVYVMTWTGICGGSKIILEHTNFLSKRGHTVTIISHDKKPDWFPLSKQVEFIQVPYGQILGKSIPKCDIIITTYWREIYECIEQKIAPVVYFEQGDFHLFDLDKMDDITFDFIKRQFQVVSFIYTVSTFASKKIKEIYGRESKVIPNAVNNDIFYSTDNKTKDKAIEIALIGDENSAFKRIDNILKALNLLKESGYSFNINWVTPTSPKRNKIEAIVNPEQRIIGEILRKSDIFICASMYESFCLPVLEAMSCGTAVITTNNGGNMDFVRNNENAVLIEKDNIDDICQKVALLIKDETFRKKIAKNAIITSKEFSWERTISEIERYYIDIARYQVISNERQLSNNTRKDDR